MSRTVLFAPETFNLAEVTRGIEIARRLDARCVFAGYSARYAHVVAEAGFEYRPLRPELTDAQADQLLALDQGRGLRHPFTEEMLGRRVSAERDLIAELQPFAVVIGTTMSQLISARAEGVPLVYVKPFAYSVPHVRAMRTTGFLPRRTGSQRGLDAAMATAVRAVLPRVPLVPRSFPRVARAHGVRLAPTALRALDADLNLITTAPHLLPDRLRLPEDYRVVGPVYAALPGPVPDLVAELAARPEPLVYFAVGSSGNRDLVRAVLGGLGGARCQVLAPVRQYLTDDDLARLPRNVHVTGWLPADRLGDAIDLAITHGGEGTVQTSSAQGWPFIGIPLQLEQRFNVQRCVDFGSAQLVSPRRAERVDWPVLVERALADGRMRSRAQEMATLLRGMDGSMAAAAEISALAGTGTR
ncbi:MAG TPA: nucleotide disphospho-sugar-binding domain-containing protein [Actinomycetaceae bacterium]|nr:nucleotide disphospho-sugar-binding domain-containing protein [Actinomycetaceae bacterium]